ncbi:MAG: hypothetical protein U5J63_00500 [Fodinibius sp.]|nr:hypothetical protein [Fodinibius sp.]
MTPSIPERYGDELKGKYEVLQDERQQMRRELKQSNRALQGELEKDKNESKDNENAQDTSETQEMANEEPSAEQKQRDTEQDTSASKEMNRQDAQEEEAPAIADPELQPEKVELNLGGNKQDSTAGQRNTEKTNAANQTSESNEAEQSQDAVEGPSLSYYLIGGSFEVEQNAIDMRNKLQDKGFDSAIINMNNSDIMLVTYQGFDDLGKAKNGLAKIQETENAEAWLYKAQ